MSERPQITPLPEESTRPELRQHWTKGHEWTFVLDRDKLIMDANEKGNHFHNDIPLDQIDPYESEERFFPLRWPIRLIRFSCGLGLVCLYAFGVFLLATRDPQWGFPVVALLAAIAAGIGAYVHVKHNRTLLRFYHRMTGMELFAVFADLPDRESAAKFLATLKQEVPPWSYTFGGPSKTENIARELKALHQLRKDNVLTDPEFQFKKRELLAKYLGHEREIGN